MSSDREILNALEFTSPGLSNQPKQELSNSTTVNSPKSIMPKIILEDERPTPTKIRKLEEKEAKPSLSFNLESIFTSEFLSTLTVDDLDKSLKDIILNRQLDATPVWHFYEQSSDYVSELKFASSELLTQFLVGSFNYVDSFYRLSTPNSVEVYIGKDNKDNISLVNKVYSDVISVKKKIEPDIELEYEQIHIPLSYQGEVVQRFESGKEYLLKIPVAKVGTWKHPVYTEVSFTSEDLDDILSNFNQSELGFEPPVYFGHSAGDGTPAQGYLQKLEREGDILFGYWQVNKEAYRLVEDEVYRYSSAEIILNLTSKATGKRIGKAIYGMALTNIPFVPDLPKIQALEHANIKSDVVFLSFTNNDTTVKTINSNQEIDMPEQVSIELALKEQVEAYAAKVKELELTRQELEQASKLNELKAQIEQYSQKEAEYVQTTQQLSTVVEQNKQLADKIEQYEESIRAKEVQSKVAKLDSLPLPTEFKQVYSNLIKEGKLGETESIVLGSLESLAQKYAEPIVEQTGSTEVTQNLNSADYEDPYQKEIERCKKLIEQRISK